MNTKLLKANKRKTTEKKNPSNRGANSVWNIKDIPH